jgi:hypothetical protein
MGTEERGRGGSKWKVRERETRRVVVMWDERGREGERERGREGERGLEDLRRSKPTMNG